MLRLSLTAHAMEKDETITLTDSKKIGYAMALNEAIDQASKKVTECVEKNWYLKKSASACIPPKLAR